MKPWSGWRVTIGRVNRVECRMPIRLASRFEDALVFAARLHREQRRKGSGIPYVSHLLAVAALVVEHGEDEDQAIAALLHDAIEDQGDRKARDEMLRRNLGSPPSAKSPRRRCTAFGSCVMYEVMAASTKSRPAALKKSGDRISAGRLLDEVRSVKGKETRTMSPCL